MNLVKAAAANASAAGAEVTFLDLCDLELPLFNLRIPGTAYDAFTESGELMVETKAKQVTQFSRA